jgi:hypothetical protein
LEQISKIGINFENGTNYELEQISKLEFFLKMEQLSN